MKSLRDEIPLLIKWAVEQVMERQYDTLLHKLFEFVSGGVIPHKEEDDTEHMQSNYFNMADPIHENAPPHEDDDDHVMQPMNPHVDANDQQVLHEQEHEQHQKKGKHEKQEEEEGKHEKQHKEEEGKHEKQHEQEKGKREEEHEQEQHEQEEQKHEHPHDQQ
ncbi:hypothetical protein Dimus_012813, partial [Dionaea muscipula]